MSTQTTTLTPPQSDRPLAPDTVAPPMTEDMTGRAGEPAYLALSPINRMRE